MGHQATATEQSVNPYGHLIKSLSVIVPGGGDPVEAEYFDLVGGFGGEYCEFFRRIKLNGVSCGF